MKSQSALLPEEVKGKGSEFVSCWDIFSKPTLDTLFLPAVRNPLTGNNIWLNLIRAFKAYMLTKRKGSLLKLLIS